MSDEAAALTGKAGRRPHYLGDGEVCTVRLAHERLRLACCDCYLVHDVDLSIHRGVATLRFFQNRRCTAHLRRRRAKTKEEWWKDANEKRSEMVVQIKAEADFYKILCEDKQKTIILLRAEAERVGKGG